MTEPELCDEPVDDEPLDEPLPLEDEPVPLDAPLAADELSSLEAVESSLLDDEESSSPEDEPLAVEASFEVELPVVVELEREVLACCVAFVDAEELAPR